MSSVFKVFLCPLIQVTSPLVTKVTRPQCANSFRLG